MFLTDIHVQQTTFENIVVKGEIINDKQFVILPQIFQFYSIIILSFVEIFHIFAVIWCTYLVHGAGLTKDLENIETKICDSIHTFL